MHTISKELKLNYNSTSKRIKQGIELGLIKQTSKGYIFLSLSNACNTLLPCNSSNKHIRLFTEGSSRITYNSINEIYERIKREILLLNFNQQDYFLNKVRLAKEFIAGQPRTHESNYKERLKAFKELSKKGYTEKQIVENQAYIKTGSNHLKSITGFCQSTNNNLLNKLHKEEYIKRKKIVKLLHVRDYSCNDNAAFDFYKAQHKYVGISCNTFYVVLGSCISINYSNKHMKH